MNGLTLIGLTGMAIVARLVTSNGRIAAILAPEYELCGSCGAPIDPYTAECRCSE